MFGLNDNNQDDSTQKPADEPADSTAPALHDEPLASEPSPANEHPDQISMNHESAPPVDKPAPAPNEDALIGLKQQALSSLSPLVNHLDQSPEEKFKTMMMLIQASDNSSLIKQAYEAANHISDEKVRAQALLDVINEINYFTQKNSKDKTKSF
jgi:hypothetical protein